MKLLQKYVVVLVPVIVLVLSRGTGTSVAQTQPYSVADLSCAAWLQFKAESETKPDVNASMKEIVRAVSNSAFYSGLRGGYAFGVMSGLGVMQEKQGVSQIQVTNLRNAGELVTALDAYCAQHPGNRLIDGARELLGVR